MITDRSIVTPLGRITGSVITVHINGSAIVFRDVESRRGIEARALLTAELVGRVGQVHFFALLLLGDALRMLAEVVEHLETRCRGDVPVLDAFDGGLK